MYNQNLGKIGEKRAEELLVKKGYQILQKNFRTKLGEIDIIAKDSDTIVFVEVKCRTNLAFGEPYEAINRRKLWQIQKAGELYLIKNKQDCSLRNSNLPKAMRIDVVSVLLSKAGEVARIELLQNVSE